MFRLCIKMLIRILNSVLKQMGHLNHCFIGSLALLFRLLFSLVLSPVQTDATLLANNCQHCWMLHVESVCTPCCMLLSVVGSCCAKFDTGQKFSHVQTDATLLANNSQHCWMLHVESVCTPCCMLLSVVGSCCAKFDTGQKFSHVQTDATLLANNSQHCWMLHVESVCTPCCMLLSVVGSCCAKFDTGQKFSHVQTDVTTPIIVAQQFWDLLRPFARSVTKMCSVNRWCFLFQVRHLTILMLPYSE